MENYIEKAKDFCKKTGTVIDVKYKCETDRFPGEEKATGKRNQFLVTIKRNGESFQVTFTDSIANYKKQFKKTFSGTEYRIKPKNPTEYDILACLTKYDPLDFEDFISEYGYTFNSEREYIKIKNLYFDVKDEYNNVYNLFSDVMDELSEIC